MASQQKGQGAQGPGSKLARVLLTDLLLEVNGPGSEKAWYHIAQSRLECIDAGCIHRPLHLLMTLLEKIFGNIPSAPGLNQFACMTPSTFTICIQDKKTYNYK